MVPKFALGLTTLLFLVFSLIVQGNKGLSHTLHSLEVREPAKSRKQPQKLKEDPRSKPRSKCEHAHFLASAPEETRLVVLTLYDDEGWKDTWFPVFVPQIAAEFRKTPGKIVKYLSTEANKNPRTFVLVTNDLDLLMKILHCDERVKIDGDCIEVALFISKGSHWLQLIIRRTTKSGGITIPRERIGGALSVRKAGVGRSVDFQTLQCAALIALEVFSSGGEMLNGTKTESKQVSMLSLRGRKYKTTSL